MNIWGILLIILIIIVGLGMFQQGFQGFKEKPIMSSIEASKTIGEKTVDTFQWSKDKIQGSSDSLKNLGLPLCSDNSSCNTLQSCKDNLCSCIQGECFKEVK